MAAAGHAIETVRQRDILVSDDEALCRRVSELNELRGMRRGL